MIIKYEMKVIELTKAEAKKAQVFGSAMYRMVNEAKADNPGFEVEVKKASKRSNEYKGLTYSYMEKYIKAKNNKEVLEAYYTLIGKNESEDGKKVVASYLEVRDWFLAKFPEIASYREEQEKKIREILDQVA